MVKTLVIDNLKGKMTPFINGDINSGLANVVESGGYDPFSKSGSLTWYEESTQIDASGSVVTDLILAGKVKVESGITYVYAIGHTGRLYKIQVNDPTTYNPNYDNPVLLTNLTVNSPTFTAGGFIDFFGATERIYIGHDKGVTRIDFDGTNETFVGLIGSWTQTVPRPFTQFVGKLYVGNGTNIAEIDSTATVTTYTKLSPAFPTGSQVRDMDVTPEGTYLQIVVSDTAVIDVTLTTVPTSIISPGDSYLFSWNGTDNGYTSFITYPGTVLSANTTFGSHQYLFGYDYLSGGVWNPIDKFQTSLPVSAFSESPTPNSVFGAANLVYWATPLPFNGQLTYLLSMYGNISTYELDVEPSYWAPGFQYATGVETDVLRIPMAMIVSNFAQGTSFNGYTNGIFGEPKIYFSTLETSPAPTTKYKLYRWSLAPSGLGIPTTEGLYQTQQQLFKKKVNIGEVRVYGEPWSTGTSFQIDLIGSGLTPIPNGSYTFTTGGNINAGSDYTWYSPSIAPTFSLGVRITNLGTSNHVISKIEIDYDDGGK